jgi:hypothetical protein
MTAQVEAFPLGARIDLDTLGIDERDRVPMRACLALSERVFKGTIDGQLACVWGLCPSSFLSGRAYLWMHVKPIVAEHQFIFVRHSQRILEELLKEYPVILGHCHVRDERAIRWIKWLGGVFAQPKGIAVTFQIVRKSHG